MESRNSPAIDALYDALADLAPHITVLAAPDRASMLKCAVFAAVDELKRLGLSSPRVETVILTFVANAWPTWTVPDAVAEIRAWCIQRYFGPRS